jgi:hypothetical protein
MGNSAPVPPDDRDAPEGLDLEDETEMTSIMDAEQRRELQRVTRAAKEPDRETARPPPEAVQALEAEAEVVIPKAAAVPAEAVAALPSQRPAKRAAAATPLPRAPSSSPASSATWFVLAFVLLAAAIAFEMR